jgi:hypothetical protein
MLKWTTTSDWKTKRLPFPAWTIILVQSLWNFKGKCWQFTSLALISTDSLLVYTYVYVTALEGYWESQLQWILRPWMWEVLDSLLTDSTDKVRRSNDEKHRYLNRCSMLVSKPIALLQKVGNDHNPTIVVYCVMQQRYRHPRDCNKKNLCTIMSVSNVQWPHY